MMIKSDPVLKVGMVFQYPEQQPFEETVVKRPLLWPEKSGTVGKEADEQSQISDGFDADRV